MLRAMRRSGKVRLAIVDEDNSELSARIVVQLGTVETLKMTSFSDRALARKELAASNTDLLLCIGPSYHRRVTELDLYDLFHVDEGRLNGKLESLDMQIESAPLLSSSADVVRELVFSFVLRTISPEVLRKYPSIAIQIMRTTKRSKERADGLERRPAK